jgi:hypothetical protein
MMSVWVHMEFPGAIEAPYQYGSGAQSQNTERQIGYKGRKFRHKRRAEELTYLERSMRA